MRYWKRTNLDGSTNTVESYSHSLEVEGTVEITKAEYDAFIASLPPPIIEPVRNLEAEIDDLKARIEKLERR